MFGDGFAENISVGETVLPSQKAAHYSFACFDAGMVLGRFSAIAFGNLGMGIRMSSAFSLQGN